MSETSGYIPHQCHNARCFLSPVSWEWDTNVTIFSVVFVYKLLYNAGNEQREIKEKKQIENKRETSKAKR